MGWLLFRKILPAALLFTALAVSAEAAPDFYGVKMKSEDFTKDVFLIENNKIADFSNNRPGTDKRVYAYGYMSSVLGGGHGFALQVYNHSDHAIATEKLFRGLTVVTYDGRRFDRSETEMMWSRDRLEPGQDATFNFKFPGLRLEKDEIRMMICSLDMGDTLIFLFPLSAPEKPAAVVKKETPKKTVKKTVSKKTADKAESKKEITKEEKKTPAAPYCPAPIKMAQSFFRGLGERMSGKTPAKAVETIVDPERTEEAPVAVGVVDEEDKNVPPDFPLVKQEQIIEGARYQFQPEHRQQVQESQKEVESSVYRDRPWSLGNPDALFTHKETTRLDSQGFPRREAKVVVVNSDYGFVVVDAGFENGFGKNVILDVVRNGRRIGKVMVTKPRDKISGAIILPEWRTREEIRSGDIVGMSV